MLDAVFGLKDIPSWGYFAVLIAYCIGFRAIHYGLFAWQTGKLPKFGGGDDNKAAAAYEPVAGADSNKQGESEEQGVQMTNSKSIT